MTDKLDPAARAAADKVAAAASAKARADAAAVDAELNRRLNVVHAAKRSRQRAHLREGDGYDTLCDLPVAYDDDGEPRRPGAKAKLCNACRQAARALQVELLAQRQEAPRGT